MRTSPFGNTSIPVSVIGQGTWKIEAGHIDGSDALRRGIDLGMTHIDTAELYGGAENVVGKAISGRRKDVFLVSKVMPSRSSTRGVISACEASLKRLGTDYLDCYLLHWPGSLPLEDTIAGFEALVSAGKIRAWGVSNFDVDWLEEAAQIAGAQNIACNQVLYNLEERAIEERVLPWCEANNVAVVGYCPFAEGRFAPERTESGRVLLRIAEAHGATARQVALAFLTRRASLFTIPKGSKIPHVEDNAGAGSLVLSANDLAAIDRAFPMRKKKYLPTV